MVAPCLHDGSDLLHAVRHRPCTHRAHQRLACSSHCATPQMPRDRPPARAGAGARPRLPEKKGSLSSPTCRPKATSSNCFCIWPRPKKPRSPPLRAEPQWLSREASSANAAGTSGAAAICCRNCVRDGGTGAGRSSLGWKEGRIPVSIAAGLAARAPHAPSPCPPTCRPRIMSWGGGLRAPSLHPVCTHPPTHLLHHGQRLLGAARHAGLLPAGRPPALAVLHQQVRGADLCGAAHAGCGGAGGGAGAWVRPAGRGAVGMAGTCSRAAPHAPHVAQAAVADAAERQGGAAPGAPGAGWWHRPPW